MAGVCPFDGSGLQGFQSTRPSSLYPRLIDVRRSKNPATFSSTGKVGYEGRETSTAFSNPEGEYLVVDHVPCSIDSKGVGRATGAMLLPGNINKHSQWKVTTDPGANLPLGTIRDNDVVIDDEGYRYQVALNMWTFLGYTLDVIRLET